MESWTVISTEARGRKEVWKWAGRVQRVSQKKLGLIWLSEDWGSVTVTAHYSRMLLLPGYKPQRPQATAIACSLQKQIQRKAGSPGDTQAFLLWMALSPNPRRKLTQEMMCSAETRREKVDQGHMLCRLFPINVFLGQHTQTNIQTSRRYPQHGFSQSVCVF